LFLSFGKKIHYCGVGAGKRKRDSRVEEFVRGCQSVWGGGAGAHTENEALTVYFCHDNGLFSQLSLLPTVCHDVTRSIQNLSSCCLSVNLTKPASQMFESLGYFYEGLFSYTLVLCVRRMSSTTFSFQHILYPFYLMVTISYFQPFVFTF
jgi:hypothetical protein